MKLNHLDLQVEDVAITAAFFERYFGLQTRSNPNSPALLILTDSAGFVLVLQRRQQPQGYPEGFHLGFLLDDTESVRALHAQRRGGWRAGQRRDRQWPRHNHLSDGP